jgi:predicted nucleic acid-binding protein
MLIETDTIYAFVKDSDRLKPTADRLMWKIKEGELGEITASREVLHELYYVSMREGVTLDDYISRAAALTAIPNLLFLPTTPEIDLLALTLMRQYGLGSIFDAYHAATTLNQVEDHTIISTDHVFDRIPGIKRIDPHTVTN